MSHWLDLTLTDLCCNYLNTLATINAVEEDFFLLRIKRLTDLIYAVPTIKADMWLALQVFWVNITYLSCAYILGMWGCRTSFKWQSYAVAVWQIAYLCRAMTTLHFNLLICWVRTVVLHVFKSLFVCHWLVSVLFLVLCSLFWFQSTFLVWFLCGSHLQ